MGADSPAVPPVRRAALGDERAAGGHPVPQAGGRLRGEVDGEGEVEHPVPVRVGRAHPVRLRVVLEESLVGAPGGLGVVVGAPLLGVAEELALRGDHDAHVPADGAALPEGGLLGRVGPAGDRRGHLRARSAGAVQPVGAEGPEQGAVQQRAPAGVEDAGGAPGQRGQVPQAHVLRLRDPPVLARAAGHLGLHPQRPGLRLGVPELLARPAPAGPPPGHRLRLAQAPARTRSTACHCFHGSLPLREATQVKPHPSTSAAERHSSQAPGAMSDRLEAMPWATMGWSGSAAPDGLHAPAQEAVGVVDAEAQPVQHVRVRPRRPRGVHVLPLGDGVAVPGPADGARRVVPLAQPVPEAGHRGRAVAVGAGDVALVPHVVRRGGRVGAVAGGQRGQESLRQAQGVRVVQAQAGEAAGGAAAAHLAVRRAPAGVHVAGVGVAPPGPLRGGRQHLGDHRGHAVSRPPGPAGRRSRPSRAPRARPRWPTTGTSAGRRSSRPPRPWRSRAPSPRGAGCSCGSRRRRRGCAGGGPSAGSPCRVSTA